MGSSQNVAQDHREGLENLVDPASSHMLLSKRWLLHFRNAPSLESLWDIRGQGGIIIYHPVLPVRKVAQCPIKSDTGHDVMN